jgi:hypothetical protein
MNCWTDVVMGPTLVMTVGERIEQFLAPEAHESTV